MKNKHFNICFWYSRRDRGHFLSKRLNKYFGHSSMIYHNLKYEGSRNFVVLPNYTRKSVVRGLQKLFKTNHDIYFSSKYFIPAIQLTIFSLITGKPFILGIYSPKWNLIPYSRSRLMIALYKIIYIFLLRIVFTKASYIVCNSHFLRNLFCSKYPSLNKKFVCIYNGIDYDNFKVRDTSMAFNNIRFISVGTANSVSKTQGIIFLLEIFKSILMKNSNVELSLVIKSSSEHFIKQIQFAAQKISNVQVFFNEDNVAEHLEVAKFFIFVSPPNTSDSLPRSIIEASAMGLPVIATNSAGNGEIIINNITGFICKYSSKDIQNTINKAAMMDDGEYLKMSKSASELVRGRFSWRAMAESYNKLFRSII